MNTISEKVTSNYAIYDFVFIGLGASNSLILKSISEQPSLRNKKIAIIESVNKNTNDKTYCFWADPNEPIVAELAPLIRYKYDSLVINQLPKQSIQKQPYHYIRSIDLYNDTAQLIALNQYPIYAHKVETIESNSGVQLIHTNKGVIQGHCIFDSRPPDYTDFAKSAVHLHQSFYGLHIQCEADVFDEQSFEMMNFNVDQNEYTQFIYILPFSKREALIELTRFGSQKIEIDYAKTILMKKIEKDYGRFNIVADEIGCIPMTTYWQPPNENKGILNTGTRANLIKPSTGYGFKNMFAFSKMVTEQLLKADLENFNRISLKSKPRFKFYDHLLLIILLKWPYLGKSIFSTLYKEQNIKTIFSFLDEKTSLFEEVKIFAKLPFKPFLHATLIYFWKFIQPRYVYASVLVLIYVLLKVLNTGFAEYFSYVVIIIGMLWIGIPHGAVDNLLLNQSIGKAHIVFVLKYLAVVFLMFLCWHFAPLLSLLLFVAYSAFHFGESEYQELSIKTNTIRGFLKSILLGLAILLFIIASHWKEAILIISKVLHSSLLRLPFEINTAILGVLIFTSVLLILTQLRGRLQKGNFGLLVILALGCFTPLLPAFALYFITQHSFNAWRHIKVGLSLNSITLFKKAGPYTIGALFLFLLISLNFSMISHYMENIMASFFVFLSCISCPHFFMMHLFYKRH